MEVRQHFRIFGVLLPVLFFSIGTPKIGPGLATMIVAAELSTTIIESIVFLQESVSCTHVFGVLLILFGSAIHNSYDLKRTCITEKHHDEWSGFFIFFVKDSSHFSIQSLH
jgi:hypothetical protein